MNRDIGNKQLFKEKGTYVLLAGDFLNGTSDPSRFFEKLKLLQQRFKKVSLFFGNLTGSMVEHLLLFFLCRLLRSPGVCFMAIHFSDQARVTDDRTALAELIVKEYLTFPVLLSGKEFPKVSNVSPRKSPFRFVGLYFELNYMFLLLVLVKWRRSTLHRAKRF